MTKLFFSPLEFVTGKELTEGFLNVAYEITLSNGEAVI